MKLRSLRIGLALILLLFAPGISALAQDASIDQLLKKLPPPEKFAKPPIQRALQQTDPASRDPLVKQIGIALQRRDFSGAMNLSRQLTQRYPRSPGAYCLHGVLAAALRRFGEADGDFRKAIAVQPHLPFAYFMLGNVEAIQQHFTTALPHFQKAADLEPKNPIAWIFVSACAEKAGTNKTLSSLPNGPQLFRLRFSAAGCNWPARKTRSDIPEKR